MSPVYVICLSVICAGILALVFYIGYIINNIRKNRMVKKEHTIRPHAVMLFCSTVCIFFGLLLFQIGIFDAGDNETLIFVMLSSAACLAVGTMVALLWKSWRLTYDTEGFFFRGYDGRSMEYTYAEITDIENGCVYVGEKRIVRLDSSLAEGQEFLNYAGIQRKKQKKERNTLNRKVFVRE